MVNTRHGVIALLLVLAACGGGEGGNQSQGGAPGGAPPPPPVGYVVLREQPVTLTTELPGRTSPFETSDVRPQVNGIVLARLFTEGDQVRAGQPLYRIDPAPYQAAAASARAALQRSQSQIGATAALSRRYGELVRINAISRQEYDNAVAGASQARADVAAQRAALRSAQIDLGRTTIRAPEIDLGGPPFARPSPAGSDAASIPPARWSPRRRPIRSPPSSGSTRSMSTSSSRAPTC